MQAGHGPASGTPMMERYNSTFMVDVWKELFANAIIPLCGEALVQVQQPNLDLSASDCSLTQDKFNACSPGRRGNSSSVAYPHHRATFVSCFNRSILIALDRLATKSIELASVHDYDKNNCGDESCERRQQHPIG